MQTDASNGAEAAEALRGDFGDSPGEKDLTRTGDLRRIVKANKKRNIVEST
jgi:hypothetical protein